MPVVTRRFTAGLTGVSLPGLVALTSVIARPT
jgi:hypothetical protein